MRFTLENVQAPVLEPVTLAEMITHLREFSSLSPDRQTEISGLIAAARQWVENYTGRALVEQSWKLTIDRRLGNVPARPIIPVGWPENGYGWITWDGPENWLAGWMLHRSPVIAITSFVSLDDTGAETAIDSSAYLLQQPASKWPRVMSTSGGALPGNKFSITFRAGYAPSLGSPDLDPDVALVPQIYKQAIKLYAGALYDRDKDMMAKLMDAAEAVIRSERAELSIA